MTDRLDRIEARANAATEGPWSRSDAQIRHTQIDGWVDPVGRAAAQAQTESDIQFVMNARTDIPALTAALRAVLGLHKPSRREHARYNANGTLITYTVTEDGPCVACYPDTKPTHCEDCDDESCTGHGGAWMRQPWPCPTVAAINYALEGGE